MKTTEKRQEYLDKISTTFINAVESGNAVFMKPWKASTAMMPHNPATGTVYQGFNNIYLSILQMQYNSEDPRWITFLNAKDKGYQIEKGSKAACITYFTQTPVDKNGKVIPKESTDQAHKYIPTLKHYSVFHASQINGLPEYKIEPIHNLDENHINAQVFIDNTKAEIIHSQNDRCFYYPAKDTIHMVPRDSFNSPGDYYSTVIHEISHWTGHESRLDRDMKNRHGSPEYAKEELRAEIASYMICRELQIDFNPRNSEAYVASWCKDFKDKPEEIIKACHDSFQIMSYVKGLQPTLEKDQNISKERNSPDMEM